MGFSFVLNRIASEKEDCDISVLNIDHLWGNMPKSGKTIWKNWKQNSGPCEDCPNRDCNGYFRPKTIDVDGAWGDPNPVVLFVADSPGDNHPKDSSFEDVKRQMKDSPSDHQSHLQNFYHEEIEGRHVDWLEGEESTQIPSRFFQILGYRIHPNGGAHYINAKRCADIYPKDHFQVENHAARHRCRTYLGDQLEFLDPDAVICLGLNAFREVIKSLDRDCTVTGNLSDRIKPNSGIAFEKYGRSPALIPSYHFRTVFRNYNNVGFEDPDEYWKKLAERTVEILEE